MHFSETFDGPLAGEDSAALHAARQRWAAREQWLDGELPVREVEPATDAILEHAGGRLSALGAPQQRSCAPDSFEALWGALRRDSIELWWDGDILAFERLLDRWIARVAEDPRIEGDWENSMSLVMPARDSDAAIPLLARGFAVVGVCGIRVGLRQSCAVAAEAALYAAGYTVRAATPADIPVLAEMDAELLAHDARHGSVSARPGATRHLASGIAARLRLDPGWTWLVQTTRGVVGYLSIEIDRDRHRAQCNSSGQTRSEDGSACSEGTSVAHVQAMYLRPEARGSGLGEQVMEFGHGQIEAAGISRTLLDYAALNPRSGPFWCRMGYRPLWYTWQRRPVG